MNFDVIYQGVNPDKALIYMWEIYDRNDVLVGRYVARLIAGQPYRKSNPNSYRVVHKALADAVDKNYVIKLYFLANINEGEDINQVEQTLINQHDCKGSESWQLNG
ncbi:TPA: hypothetical protein RUZ94_003516 [Vibrio cholerae]|nr:hypothetical protein [Vibrio cholerae]